MPFYLFENVETGEYKEVFFHMNDEKIYNGEDGTQVGVWSRRYYSPNAGVDTRINPESARDFVEKTGRKKGTIGDILDASAEMSARRTEIMGKDPLIQKYKDEYSGKRKGKKNPSEARAAQKAGITVSLGG